MDRNGCSNKRHSCFIQELPVEILVASFRHLLTNGGANYDHSFDISKQLHTLAQVCKAWLQVVKSTPRLWTTLYRRKDVGSIQAAKIALKLSQSQPLEIKLDEFFGPDPKLLSSSEHGDGAAWLSVVAEDLGRWRTAAIYTALESIPQSIQQTPALNLEKLIIWNDRFDITVILPLFGEIAPKLRDLWMNGLALPNWSTSILHGLTRLRIENVRIGGPTIRQTVAMLQECPDLVKLELDSIRFNQDDSHDISPVALDHLQELWINEITEGNDFVTLVCLINAPNCTEYQFGGSPDVCNDFNMGALFKTSSHISDTPAFRQSLSSAYFLIIVYHQGGITVKMLAREEPVFIYRSPTFEDYECGVLWLVLWISSLPSIPIVLSWECSGEISTEVFDELRHPKNVVMLTLNIGASPLELFIEELGRPREIDGQEHWLFPKLISLKSDHCEVERGDILKLAKRRSDGYQKHIAACKASMSDPTLAPIMELQIDEGYFTKTGDFETTTQTWDQQAISTLDKLVDYPS